MQRPLEDPLATIIHSLAIQERHRSWAPESVTSTATPGSPPQATVLVTMDPGQDLDDEMLIVLLSALQRRGNVRCVGVVATLAPAAMRAQLARGTLDELGMRDVPVGAGSDGGASGSTDFEGLAYMRPPRCGLDGEQLMSEVLEAADERSLTIVVVSSLKDVAGLLQREEALFVRKVKEVVIQGGVKPFDEAEPGSLLEPDTAHNNEFDHDASAFFYRRCQELNVPLIVVSRFCAYQCQMPRKIYDDMAATGSSIGKHLKDSQATSIEQLWKRANAEGAARTGLPPRCDRTWFCDTFCGGEGKERDGGAPIWDLIVAFNMYDPLALVASVPQLASKYFEFEEVRVGNTTHRVAGVSKEQCGVKAGSGLPEMLLAAFLEGIQPPAGTELQRLRAELLEERATSARLQQEVDGLRALK
jgi:inosine-uridine nucleoside N-ribohydrolase